MIAIDTNIWIYSHDTRDAAKQPRAGTPQRRFRGDIRFRCGNALIVAACRGEGAHTLYTEDMAPGRIEGIAIVNPLQDR